MATRTLSTNPPAIDCAAVMRRAWAIFKETYSYPAISMASIGRHCFAWALKKAWAEAKAAAKVCLIAVETRVARINDLKEEREGLVWIDNWSQAEVRRSQIYAQIRQLAA